MDTQMKRRSQRTGGSGGGGPNSSGLNEMRTAVRDVADAGDDVLLHSMSDDTEEFMRSLPQQSGQ